MFSKLRSILQPILDVVTIPFLWMSPTLLNFLALVFALLSGYFLAKGNNILAAVLFLGNIFDVFDGHVARKTGKVTKFGGLLDTVLDRISEAIFFFGAAYGGFISFELAYIGIVASLMVSFIKATASALVGEAHVGTNQLSVGIGQRADRMVALFFGTLFAGYTFMSTGLNYLQIAVLLVVVTSVITFLWRVAKAYNLLKGK